MDAQLEIRRLLQTEFARLKNKNPSYSLRSFARSLGVVPSALSEILSSDRPITKKMGQKILTHLSVAPDTYYELMTAPQLRHTPVAPNYIQLNMDHYYIVTDWYYYAVLSLVEVRGFKEDPQWIARRLNITVRQAKQALTRLERLEMLVRNKKGLLVPSGVQFTTTNDIANLAIRRRHMANLELAKTSLEKDPVDVRDFSEITMAVDIDKMSEAKEMIRKFRRELCHFMETGTKKEVYKLCVQLFPLSEKESQ